MKKDYKKGPLTIHWDNGKCIHAGECVKNLSNVFRPKEKPWIQPEHAEAKAITNTIDKCPSGALSYTLLNIDNQDDTSSVTSIKVIKGGPAIISGSLSLEGGDKVSRLSLCRCGNSSNMPLCDGTHKGIDFDK